MAKTKQTKSGRPTTRRSPSAKAKPHQTRRKRAKSGERGRLRPGELDGLVLAYLREHADEGPLTATAVAKGIGGRSSGAVANCLKRLADSKQVRLAKKSPRAYDLKGVKAR